jgi:K+ transporter
MHISFFKSLRAFYRRVKSFIPSSTKEVIKSLGIVFGDIGTSPIYTLYVIFILSLAPTACNVLGVLSLIVWTLITVVTVQYAWLAMSLSQKGEGGTIVLREILVPLLKRKKTAQFVTMLSFVGISFLIGDGVITPAISVLSAVEGLRLVPGWEEIQQNILIVAAALVTIVLFAFQRKGTETVSVAFGPIMVVWFLTLGAREQPAYVHCGKIHQCLLRSPLIMRYCFSSIMAGKAFLFFQKLFCAQLAVKRYMQTWVI